MEAFEVLAPIVLVLALVLLLISILAYKRERSWRLLFAAVVFALFLIKGMIMSISVFATNLEDTSKSLAFHLVFDVLILLFLFFAVLRSSKRIENSKETEEGKT